MAQNPPNYPSQHNWRNYFLVTRNLPKESLVGARTPLIIAVVFTYRTANFEYRPPNAEQITTRRAERILAGLEDYHDRTGVYPLNLWQLAPLDLIYLPKPVMYADLGWCYQSDGGGYRFGYVYTPGYNVPRDYIELRQFTGGDPPTGEWSCDRQLQLKRATAPPLPPGAGD